MIRIEDRLLKSKMTSACVYVRGVGVGEGYRGFVPKCHSSECLLNPKVSESPLNWLSIGVI